MAGQDDNGAPPATTRRAVLMGAGAVSAVGLLAACGTGSDSPAKAGGVPPGSGSSGGGATSAVKASEIPVGGGKIFPTEQIVVTQPTAGTYKAFSAICTHQGCFVTAVTNGKIECPCHMSQFNLDGTVATGPAVQPLPAKRITVSGDDLTIA